MSQGDRVILQPMRLPAATLVVCGLCLVAAGWAGAAPAPLPPKFWTVSHCEEVLRARDLPVSTADGHYFHLGQPICVGTGGPHACEWTPDRRSRVYSEFTVFSRSRYIGGVVRSFTLATRSGFGLIRVGHHAGDDYLRWAPDFFMSPASVRLLAPDVTPARFRLIVAPIAARITQQMNAAGCTGHR